MIDFAELAVGIKSLKEIIGAIKGTINMFSDNKKKASFLQELGEAENQFNSAELKIAQGFGYKLCQCTFPPNIMLSIGYQDNEDEELLAIEKYKCPNCGKISPPDSQGFQGLTI